MAVDFQLCFRVYHQKSPGKPGGTEVKWETSDAYLCCRSKSTGT
jgi:hypothetical protein